MLQFLYEQNNSYSLMTSSVGILYDGIFIYLLNRVSITLIHSFLLIAVFYIYAIRMYKMPWFPSYATTFGECLRWPYKKGDHG